MPLNNIRAIVFDVDGTLYPQRPLRTRIFLELAIQLGRRPLSQLRTLKVLRAYREAHEIVRTIPGGAGAGELQLRLTSEISGESPEFVDGAVHEWFERRPLRHLKTCLHPDLVGFLRKAHDLGIRLGVLSDYPAAEKLNAMGIFDQFDAVVSSQDRSVGVLKPNPRGLQACLQRLAVSPEECLYVGDRADVDLPCAARAHTQFVLFGRSPVPKRCVSVSSYRQLSQMLGFSSQA